MINLTLEQWTQLAIYLGGLIIAVAIIKNDVAWIKHWCREHQERNEKDFERMDEDIREIRDRLS